MSYTSLTAQALSAPPYLISFLLVLLIAYLSDRARTRAAFVILAALVGSAGYTLLAVSGALRLSSGLRYAAVFPAAAGFFMAITLIITWTLNNQASDEGKGTGVAMLNVIGQLGPLLGTRLYPEEDKPYYVKGMAICAGFMALVAVLAWMLRQILMRANAKNETLGGRGEYVYLATPDAGVAGDEEDAGMEQRAADRGQFLYML